MTLNVGNKVKFQILIALPIQTRPMIFILHINKLLTKFFFKQANINNNFQWCSTGMTCYKGTAKIFKVLLNTQPQGRHFKTVNKLFQYVFWKSKIKDNPRSLLTLNVDWSLSYFPRKKIILLRKIGMWSVLAQTRLTRY